MVYPTGSLRTRCHVAWQVPWSFLDNICVAPCSSVSVITLETIQKCTFQPGTPKCHTNCTSYCLVTVTEATHGS